MRRHKVRCRAEVGDEHGSPHLSVDLLHVVVDPQFVSFRVCGDGSVRVPSHGYLMRLYETYLTILVQHSERVSFRLEDDTNGLHAVSVPL